MKKILVVDDDEALLNILVTALQRNGYVAFAASDGRIGLQMARDHLPDLVVSDVEMPKMNGRELLAALRADVATATVPFIMMTGQPDRTSMRQGMQMGADDYLPKPFPMAEMLEAIKIRLQRHQQIRDLAVSRIAQIRNNLQATLPHELLTPLTGVLGFAEILTIDYATLQPSEILEMASEIQSSGHRLLRLVQNYLLHMELDNLAPDQNRGKSSASRITPSIREILEITTRRCSAQFGRSNDLLLEVTDSAVGISQDWFKKIVQELVDNAFRYSSAGSAVWVQSSTDPAGFHLVVQDRGRGMTADQIARIGAFQQFDRQHYEQQGLGLGLTIAKRLVNLHGGSLMINSEKAEGTTVDVRLPVSVPASA